MTPHEKAIQLCDEFIYHADEGMLHYHTNHCALIMCDELINVLPSVNGRPPNYQNIDEYCREFWIQVRYEIETNLNNIKSTTLV